MKRIDLPPLHIAITPGWICITRAGKWGLARFGHFPRATYRFARFDRP